MFGATNPFATQSPHSRSIEAMTTTTIPNSTTAFLRRISSPPAGAGQELPRRKLITTFLTTSLALALQMQPPAAVAQSWGTRSFLWEKYFQPGLSPEDAVARIRQTAEGLHDLRAMLESMSWRYVIFYIRVKQSYLSKDMPAAMATVPENLRKSYVEAANQLVDDMAEFDYYVRTPKVYESYLYYEKTLKSIDDLVAFLA